MLKRPVILLLLLLSLVARADSTQPTTIILVRHAEKQSNAGSDPDLTNEGRQRAELLARMMKDAGIKAIYASEYRRTFHTVEPLAKSLNIAVERYRASESQALIDAVLKKHAGETVLIAAHSNTIPELVKMLGVRVELVIPESDYSGIYIVTVASNSRLNVLRYGI